MSQNNNFPSVNKIVSTSSDELNNSNDDFPVVSNNGWANFDTFENNTKQNSQTIPGITANITDDDWASFTSNDKRSEKINKDEDVFGDYGEVKISPESQISSLPINFLNSEQIETLISTCFPLEPSTLSPDIDNFIPFELPTFMTWKDQTKQWPCFEHSLSLWNILSNISNDPIGIKYQWRKSNTEHLFHQALGVQERFRTKTMPSTTETLTTNSNVNNENKSSSQTVHPHFDWKQSGLENPLSVFDVNKTLDLDYYVPPVETSTSTREEEIISSTAIHRNNSPILQQQSTPIKTIDLFPGSTTVLNDDAKPPVNSLPNFSFMDPKALISPTQIPHESTL